MVAPSYLELYPGIKAGNQYSVALVLQMMNLVEIRTTVNKDIHLNGGNHNTYTPIPIFLLKQHGNNFQEVLPHLFPYLELVSCTLHWLKSLSPNVS